MVVIKKSGLAKFYEKYPQSAGPLLRWYLLMKELDCSNFAALKEVFPSVDTVGNDLYVFNIGGNKYRLIARIFFSVRTVYIRFIGTHSEYNKVKLSDL
jgi:mRNA interferase HigB